MPQTQNTIESKKVASCYTIIAAFFDAYPLPYARNYIASSLKAATRRKIWNKSEPVDLIYFIEKMEDLLYVAFTLTKSGCRREQVVLAAENTVPDITQHQFYCGWQSGLHAWHFFPRHVSAKEYHDPYKAFKKVTEWKDEHEWKEELETILHHALGATPMAEICIDMDVLKVSSLLNKLVEACHLIDVRTNIRESKPGKQQTEEENSSV